MSIVFPLYFDEIRKIYQIWHIKKIKNKKIETLEQKKKSLLVGVEEVGKLFFLFNFKICWDIKNDKSKI